MKTKTAAATHPMVWYGRSICSLFGAQPSHLLTAKVTKNEVIITLVMVYLNRSLALEGHGRLGKDTAVQNRLRSKRNGGSGQNGTFKNTVGPKSSGSAESPEDVLCFGSVDQDEFGVCSGNQGAASLEEKLGFGFVETVQSDNSAISKVDGAARTVGTRRESQASDLDFDGSGLDCHRLIMGVQHGSGESSGSGGVHFDHPPFPGLKSISTSNRSAGRDTHIPTMDRGENAIKSDGGLSVDSKVCTHIVGNRRNVSEALLCCNWAFKRSDTQDGRNELRGCSGCVTGADAD
jgi:hypothetical protein